MALSVSRLLLTMLSCLNIIITVNGNYTLNITLISYTNQDNYCSECRDDEYGCCDNFDSRFCTGSLRCDTYFEYCLLPLESALTRDRYRCSPVATSAVLTDDGPIDFSQSVVLGLSNPLLLSVTSSRWEGVRLQISALDYDGPSSYDLIDVFHHDINNTLGSVMLKGYYGLTQMEFIYQVACNEGFYGDACQFFNDCPSLDVCGENGTCIDEENSYSCMCNRGFTGDLCELIDYCVRVNCSGRGQCINGTYKCLCDAGFTGTNCETNNDDCISVNCNGQGQCVDGVNSFDCLCDPGFTGENCAVNINDCMNNNCSGNGVCVDGVNSFTCECDSSYTGELCDSILTCSSIICVNGFCNPNESTPVCVCDAGYTGEGCQDNIEEDCSGKDCSDTVTIFIEDHTAIVKSRLVFIIGVSLGGVCFLLFLLIIILTIVVLASYRAAKSGISHKSQVAKSSLKRPESFDLTDNVGYGVVAEIQQQETGEEGHRYNHIHQVGSRHRAIYGGDPRDVNEMEYYSVYI